MKRARDELGVSGRFGLRVSVGFLSSYILNRVLRTYKGHTYFPKPHFLLRNLLSTRWVLMSRSDSEERVLQFWL